MIIEIKATELAKSISQLAAALEGGNIVMTDKIIIDVTSRKKPEENQEVEKVAEKKVVEKQEVKKEVAEKKEVKKVKELASDITIEKVREIFIAKNSKANTPKLKGILEDFKVAKVTDLDPKDFAKVLEALEAI